MDLSFSGAGFMGCYYFGVVDCWNKYIPRERVNRVAGASAGSLIAAYYLMDLPLENCLKAIIGLTEEVRSRALGVFDRSHQIVDVLPKILDDLFPEDAHKRVSGRLHVVMTRLKDMKKVTVSEFDSKKDLIDALNCSCFIPVWSGNHVSTYKGVKHIDGGFSDNLPVFDEHTIRICCFSGDTDISPYDKSRKELLSATILNTPLYFTFANFKRGKKALFPPTASYILNLLETGFHDTKTFILDNDLIQCDKCWNKSNKAQLINAQISPCISPALSRVGSQRGGLNLAGKENDDQQSATKHQQFLRADNDNSNNLERSSFSRLLKLKLMNVSNETTNVDHNNNNNNNNNTSIEDLNNNNLVQPTIVIDDADDCCSKKTKKIKQEEEDEASDSFPTKIAIKKSSSGDAADAGEIKPKVFQGRRNTIQSLNELTILQDKFTFAPHPLPSCPPSPNLNRHCTECIRMRQEARLDRLEEKIREEVEKIQVPEIYNSGNVITRKLRSPLKWIKQIGIKNSYKFEQEQGCA